MQGMRFYSFKNTGTVNIDAPLICIDVLTNKLYLTVKGLITEIQFEESFSKIADPGVVIDGNNKCIADKNLFIGEPIRDLVSTFLPIAYDLQNKSPIYDPNNKKYDGKIVSLSKTEKNDEFCLCKYPCLRISIDSFAGKISDKNIKFEPNLKGDLGFTGIYYDAQRRELVLEKWLYTVDYLRLYQGPKPNTFGLLDLPGYYLKENIPLFDKRYNKSIGTTCLYSLYNNRIEEWYVTGQNYRDIISGTVYTFDEHKNEFAIPVAPTDSQSIDCVILKRDSSLFRSIADPDILYTPNGQIYKSIGYNYVYEYSKAGSTMRKLFENEKSNILSIISVGENSYAFNTIPFVYNPRPKSLEIGKINNKDSVKPTQLTPIKYDINTKIPSAIAGKYAYKPSQQVDFYNTPTHSDNILNMPILQTGKYVKLSEIGKNPDILVRKQFDPLEKDEISQTNITPANPISENPIDQTLKENEIHLDEITDNTEKSQEILSTPTVNIDPFTEFIDISFNICQDMKKSKLPFIGNEFCKRLLLQLILNKCEKTAQTEKLSEILDFIL